MIRNVLKVITISRKRYAYIYYLYIQKQTCAELTNMKKWHNIFIKRCMAKMNYKTIESMQIHYNKHIPPASSSPVAMSRGGSSSSLFGSRLGTLFTEELIADSRVYSQGPDTGCWTTSITPEASGEEEPPTPTSDPAETGWNKRVNCYGTSLIILLL